MTNHFLAFLRAAPSVFMPVLLMWVLASEASAQEVTNTADSGPGTLRSAITNAANGAVITFAPNLSGQTITLASALVINTSLTIDASALPGGIQINGNGSVRIFTVASGVTNVLNSLTIINSFSSYGGGIYNSGTLTLTNCTLAGNAAGSGGGIYNYEGTMTLNQCTLSGNSAPNGNGGGIYGYKGTMMIVNSIVAGNISSWDIYNSDATVTYGGSNIIQSVYNAGTVIGPAPLSAAPDLAPLGNYGGPTQTMPPLPGSLAIGAGSLAANTFATDQRGYPRAQNGLIDLGAVELPTLPPFTASPTKGTSPLSVQFSSTNRDSDGSAITQWYWTFGNGGASINQNPTNVYYTAGIFSPGLIVTNNLGLALGVSGPAITVNELVTNTADNGPGTLRSAITNAFEGEVIGFAPNLSGATIMLTNTLAINTSLTIDASALPGGIQINGNGSVQIFTVASGVTNVLNSLTITNGVTSTNGGGIYNSGTLTLTNCTMSGNNATDFGGGIYMNGGTLTLNQCTLSGNSAEHGGSIYINGGTLTLNQCTLSGNSAPDGIGGGIYSYGGTIMIINTIVAGNSGSPGADIYNDANLTYGGSNIIQSVYNAGTVIGPAPLSAAPDLAPLGNYGGPTQTMPPLPGSPAIGAGSLAANTFATDQRGYPRAQNGLIDLGAVELPTLPPFTASPTKGTSPLSVQFSSTNRDSDGSAITQWNWSFGDGNISANQNPTNVYYTAGIFSPGLIVTNNLGLALGVSGPAITVNGLVTSTADNGPGTLRSAITNVFAGEIIGFAPNLSGATIMLTNTLAINTTLTIDASALPGGIQINGHGSVQIFTVASGVTNVLNSLTITNGVTSTNGGGIYNSGTLTLTNCTLSGNVAGNGGGGIYNYEGTMTLNQCTLSENNGTGNYGGGIYNYVGTMTLNQCTLSGNSAPDGGGGILNAGESTTTLNQCTLSGNNASSDYGGGIFNDGALALNQCTLFGNSAEYGGGIYSEGTLSLNQCTLSGNNAAYGGGGIYGGTMMITNTIVAVNTGDYPIDIYCYATITYGGSNLVQFTNLTGPGPHSAAPDLAPLGNYGGPTQTMPPQPGSPAIGAGILPANTFTTDQRGYPRIVGAQMDIGSVEGVYITSIGKLSGVTRLGDRSIQFGLTSIPDANLAVLATTNLSLPFSEWTPIGFTIENAAGSDQYQFTDPDAMNYPQRFYRVVSP